MFRASTFLKEALRQMRLLRNIRNIQHDEQYKSGLLNVIKEGMINFESYSFIRRCEFVVGKNIRWQNYVKTHHFLVSVQNLAPCTTYGKFMLESKMAMLTPKSGIEFSGNDAEL